MTMWDLILKCKDVLTSQNQSMQYNTLTVWRSNKYIVDCLKSCHGKRTGGKKSPTNSSSPYPRSPKLLKLEKLQLEYLFLLTLYIKLQFELHPEAMGNCSKMLGKRMPWSNLCFSKVNLTVWATEYTGTREVSEVAIIIFLMKRQSRPILQPNRCTEWGHILKVIKLGFST